eukprot:jgi/Bigna1/39740/e_gw1.35.18.1
MGSDIETLQKLMASGDITSVELTKAFLRRIKEIDQPRSGKENHSSPCLRSIMETNPDAISIAKERDEERTRGINRGMLHGIPILVKDNINSGDSMQTTAGSIALLGHRAREDAFVLRKLRENGAVLLGKTSMSEWANFRSTSSISGWCSRGGLTRNPYVLDRTAMGSSSGSASAVAAGLGCAAIGTETDGSIVWPAACCSLVGLKPTVGLASRSGIIPISCTQDTPGPMARTVKDAAILLSAMCCAADETDLATCDKRAPRSVDYRLHLKEDGLKGARIGVARELFPLDKEVAKVFEDGLAVMREKGAVIVDPLPPTLCPERYRDQERAVLQYDMSSYASNNLPPRKSFIRNIEELIAFNLKHKDTVMPHFAQERVVLASKRGGLEDKEYKSFLTAIRRLSRGEGIDRAMSKHSLDAIVCPSMGVPWQVVRGRAGGGDSEQACSRLAQDPSGAGGEGYTLSATPAAVAGYPHITVPAGFVAGHLPVGMSFFSGPWREDVLLRLAFSFEQATKAMRPPKFIPHVDYAAAAPGGGTPPQAGGNIEEPESRGGEGKGSHQKSQNEKGGGEAKAEK